MVARFVRFRRVMRLNASSSRPSRPYALHIYQDESHPGTVNLWFECDDSRPRIGFQINTADLFEMLPEPTLPATTSFFSAEDTVSG